MENFILELNFDRLLSEFRLDRFNLLFVYIYIGSERQFLECKHEDAGQTTCSKDYAAVACYSSSKPTGTCYRNSSS